MNKRYIMILIVLIAMGAAIIYYFYNIFSIVQPVDSQSLLLPQDFTGRTLESVGEEEGVAAARLPASTAEPIKEKGLAPRSFRDPFEKYDPVTTVQAEELAANKIRSLLPFTLKGIIGKEGQWLALLETSAGSRIIKDDTVLDEFQIVQIEQDGISLIYRGISFKLEIGSDDGDQL